ncbi:brct domain containing protein [Moelleriella libera RCEF 2490]|uniref:Brct domain containing protein n=1 Tax=Moelleriella libera RCEF 2490 TaxID=1081109 RepID=A0A167WG01_9HYPO|nr:brct domain containing protein [Moelleriella libera RCEF 2490]
MDPPQDLVIALSGQFTSITKTKTKKGSKGFKQRDIQQFFKALGVLVLQNNEISKEVSRRWNVVLTANNDRGSPAVVSEAESLGLCVLNEAWLQECVKGKKLIQPRLDHFRQIPKREAYESSTLYNFLGSHIRDKISEEQPGTHREIDGEKKREAKNEKLGGKTREKDDEDRQKQEKEGKAGKEKEKGARKDRARKYREKRREEDAMSLVTSDGGGNLDHIMEPELLGGKLSDFTSGASSDSDYVPGSESSSDTESNPNDHADSDEVASIRDNYKEQNPFTDARMTWYRKGNNKSSSSVTLITPQFHPGDMHLPPNERRQSCPMVIEFVYKYQIFVSEPQDFIYKSLPNLRTLYSVKAKDYPLQKEQYILNGGHVLVTHQSTVLQNTSLIDFDWWGTEFDGRYCVIWGRPRQQGDPMLFTRTTMKEAYGGQSVDTVINEIRQAMQQAPMKVIKQVTKEDAVSVRSKLQGRSRIAPVSYLGLFGPQKG